MSKNHYDKKLHPPFKPGSVWRFLETSRSLIRDDYVDLAQKMSVSNLKQERDKRPMFSGKKIGVYFFDTFANAKKILEQKFSKRPSLDEIQVVIKQEGNMEDPELQKYGRVYAGAAWYIIHERRVADGLVTKIETDE